MSTIVPNSDLNTLHARILAEIPNGSSVLDVGAGLAKYHQLLLDQQCFLTLIDAHRPYLDERNATLRQVLPLPQQWLTIHADAVSEVERIYQVNDSPCGDKHVTALAIDFIEHLDLLRAEQLIQTLCKIADTVILFAPEGNHPQSTDHYGLGGDHWQTHRSTWNAEMLEALGFTVERWVDFHRWAADRGCDPGALWATWRHL